MKPGDDVRISVVIPSRNYGQFIGEAVASVLRNPGIGELIVQDGLSEDRTHAVLSTFTDPRLSIISEADSGQSQALNRALARSHGDVIGWLNADEFYLPGISNIVSRIFSENPDIDVLYGDCIFCYADSSLARLVARIPPILPILQRHGCYIPSCAMFFRRQIWVDFQFNETMRRVMDWEWYLRTMSKGVRFAYVPLPLGAYRVHPDQVTADEVQASRIQRLLHTRSTGEQLQVRRGFGGGKHRLTAMLTCAIGDVQYWYAKHTTDARIREQLYDSIRGRNTSWLNTSDAAVDSVHREVLHRWASAGRPIHRSPRSKSVTGQLHSGGRSPAVQSQDE